MIIPDFSIERCYESTDFWGWKNRHYSRREFNQIARGQSTISYSTDKWRDLSPKLRREAAEHGQHPYAVVIACSDSREIPEAIFSAGIGELFVIRVAGIVRDRHQLGSVEYAAAHLHCPLTVVLGHTRCGAVGAAIAGSDEGYIKSITDEIHAAIGAEKDERKTSELNVRRNVRLIQEAFKEHPELQEMMTVGAVYDVETGEADWLS